MEKLQIFQVLECNKVLYKILEQRMAISVSVGLKINRIMKLFDEVEEYVFTTMDMAFQEINWENLTKEQNDFYEKLISEQIELEYNKIPTSFFEENDNLKLTIEDIERLSIILC